MAFAKGADPVEAIVARSREIVLDAQDDGWTGPPFDPFELASRLGIELVARDDLDDARLTTERGRTTIEFNPNRPRGRVRFSVAHEIGHWLFPDHADEVRNRSHREGRRGDDWQIELLCNLAAAEILLPIGSLVEEHVADLSINHLMDLQRAYDVSTEALLLRVVRISERPAAAFAAARVSGKRDAQRFRIDYFMPSNAWRATPKLERARRLEASGVLAECTAIGSTAFGQEDWLGESLHVEAVGIPPYPGQRYPRIVGLVRQASDVPVPPGPGIRYLRGDASTPRHTGGHRVIAHVVNNKANRWGGAGFALALTRRFPVVAKNYEAWATTPGNRKLGAVHVAEAGPDLTIVSMVAQSGYGASDKPRIRYSELSRGLAQVGDMAQRLNATVHMPLIGTGQAGGRWPAVRDLVYEQICSRGVNVIAYVLGDAPMPVETEVLDDQQLSFTVA